MGGGQSQIEQPKVVRMPNATDPSLLAARDRILEQIKSRGGRLSTIMTNGLKGMLNGSGGLLGR